MLPDSLSDQGQGAVDRPQDGAVTLGLLRAVGEDASASQRLVARRIGVAVGLINATIKRCAAKGWIKVNQLQPNRLSYYLTPEGFAEKARLTSEYLSQSFSLFRDAREQYGLLFAQCARRGWRRVALYGLSELTDVAVLCAREADVQLVALMDPGADRPRYLDLPCHSGPVVDVAVDAVVVTAMWNLPEAFARLGPVFEEDRILAPAMLSSVRQRGDGPSSLTAQGNGLKCRAPQSAVPTARLSAGPLEDE